MPPPPKHITRQIPYLRPMMKAQVYNHSEWIRETQPQTLKQGYGQRLLDCGFQVLGFMEHHFQPQGYTAVWLLAESHFALHTFPEEGKTYVELTSCNLQKYEAFLEWESLHTQKNG